jgi:hypothetical protein
MSEAPQPSRTRKVMTAERAKPIASARPLAKRLEEMVADQGLNALSIARESWEMLRGTDSHLRTKALIVGAWIALSVTSLVVACPGSIQKGNALGAELVIANVADHPVYMVKNDGKQPWKDVIVVVNGKFRAAIAVVQPGNNITFGPKQLLGDNGQLAPEDLTISELELRTSDGHTTLMASGVLQ